MDVTTQESKVLNKRHVGVTVFGLLLIIFPISNFLLSVFYYNYALQPLQYLFILFSIITGVGVLLLQELARKAVIVFAGLMILVSLAMFFINPEVIFKNNINLIVNLYMFIFGGLLLYFFTRSKVKGQFK